MNRTDMIKWLSENTTHEQWFNRNTLFLTGGAEGGEHWETVPYASADGVCVRGYNDNKKR